MPSAKQRKKTPATSKRRQLAAIPVRVGADGQPQVLLLTSRGTGRWVIPKGWPMRKFGPADAAAREAYEEAGLEGTIRPSVPVGSYHYAKAVADSGQRIKVKVYLLHVERQLESWPEQDQRETRWFSPEEAAGLVAEPELAALLRRTPDLLARQAA